MQAIIQTGGQQFTVQEGDEILVQLLPVPVGENVRFDQVLFLSDSNGVKIGTPTLPGVAVLGKVKARVKGPKTRALSFRRRKDSRTVRGHRQQYLRVAITGIEGVAS